MDKIIATVDVTSRILRENDINPKFRYGQNFLVTPKTPEAIANNCLIDDETLVIEIGPGLGALTQFLVERAKQVVVYEIDTQLAEILQDTFKDVKNIEINNMDFMKVDLDNIKDYKYSKTVIVSNLPYYITSDILNKIFLSQKSYDVIAMVQKEVAQRILHKKDINELVLYSHLFNDVSKLIEVGKNEFFPKPRVDSTVLLFRSKNKDKNLYKELVQALFSQKRKTIFNNLKVINGRIMSEEFIDYVLYENHLDRNTRIDGITLEQTVQLLDTLRNSMYVKCPCKINVGLNITGVKDGMHLLDSLFVPFYDMQDAIVIYPIQSKTLDVSFDVDGIDPVYNSIFNSVRYLMDGGYLTCGFDISVHKAIPMGSGLGGGSSNAGTVLLHIEQIYHIDHEVIIDACLQAGTDAVYFLNPVPCLMKSFREYAPVELDYDLEISVYPMDIHVSTEKVYKEYDRLKKPFSTNRIDPKNLDLSKVQNDLEEPVINLYPDLKFIMNAVKKMNAYEYISFSGSGSTIIGVNKKIKQSSEV